MDKGEEKRFTVGELARRCGVTVRTLQYYDKEGLLSPRHYTEGGRRLYDREDILLLQQILFLKSFGFSLGEIRDKLLHADSPAQISRIFARQRDVLKEQIAKHTEMVGLLDKTIGEIEMNGELGTEKLVAIMGMMSMNNPYSFVFRYLGSGEMKKFFKWVDSDEEEENTAAEWAQWQELFSKLIELYKEGVDPEGEEGQAFAAEWWAMVQKSTKGDPDMLQSLMDMGGDVDNWPDQAGDFKIAARDFLGKAFDKYFQDNGVMPERSTEQ